LKKFSRNFWYLFVISGSIIALDQLTKAVVRQNLALGESWMPWAALAPYFRVLHWYNTGVAFGMFQQGGIIFILLPIVIVVGIIVYFQKIPNTDWALSLALSLQLGGALGNLIDRLTLGHVTDFISVGSFPVFNIADSAITVGVMIMILGVWQQEQREKKERMLTEAANGNPSDTLPKSQE
jgi:signal peptidase II